MYGVGKSGVTILLLVTAIATVAPNAAASGPSTYSYTFEDGAPGPEWSSQSVSTTPTGARRFLGELATDVVTLSLTGLPTHQSARLDFELFILKSWDGDDPYRCCGPDIFDLSFDGATTLLHTTFSNHDAPFYHQAYPGAHPGSSYPARTGASENNTLGYTFGGDAVYRLSFTIEHSSAVLTFAFQGQSLQEVADESWGLDNVVVTFDPSSISVPSQSVGQDVPGTSSPPVPSQTQTTPAVIAPATCSGPGCTSPTTVLGPQTVTTPGQAPIPLKTPDVPIPRQCAVVICVGPAVIPGQDLGSTPAVPSQSQTTDAVIVPAMCSLAGPVCLPQTTLLGPQTVGTPGVPSIGLTPPISVAVSSTGFEGSVSPHAGELGAIGPTDVQVGPVPVTLCPATCPVPVPPNGRIQGSITVSVTVGTQTFAQTFPVDLAG